MPKGVEHLHNYGVPQPNNQRVESLMPKGVEHGRGSIPFSASSSVESLMPKGVEHRVSEGVETTEVAVSNL